jgi:hypothetical protein
MTGDHRRRARVAASPLGEETDTMIGRYVRGALAIALAVVLVAPLAHAGGGGAGLGGVAFLQCWVIEGGANPAHVLSVNDQFTNPTLASVGKARLVCTPADGVACTDERDPTTNQLLMPECKGRVSPTLQVVDGDVSHLTCYDRGPDNVPASNALVKLTDPFGEQTVRVRKPDFLCTGAVKECLPDPKTGETRCPVTEPPPAQ